ncbi:MAG TPA: DUF3108 domain-containing protein [Burkholderiales bacterium]|jgi:hypothetical protein
MMRLALIVLLFLAGPAWAVQPPPRVQMDFDVNSGSMHLGEGRDVLEHDGKQYSVVSESKTVGVAAFLYKMNIRRESRGLVTKGGLRPLHFQEERTRKPKRAADFDWEAKQLKLTDGENVSTVALPDNSFDQTSFAYAFAFRSPDEELPPVHLTDGRKLSDYKYQMVGKEKIKTPIGELETLHFQKVREADDKRGFEVWLAIEHHYLPVKIRVIEKDGTVLDSTVTAISYQ